MKILWYSDSPTIQTGFSQFARHVLSELKDHDIDVLAYADDFSWKDPRIYPYRIHGVNPFLANNGLGGSAQLRQMLQNKYDILVTAFDIDKTDEFVEDINKARKEGRLGKWVMHTTLDTDDLKELQMLSVKNADLVITNTEFCKKAILKLDPSLEGKIVFLPYGTETDIFYPADHKTRTEWRKELIGRDDVFLLTFVGRNQPRKDLGRLMQVYREFKKIHNDAMLFLNCARKDNGGDLVTMAYYVGLKPDEIFFTKPDFQPLYGHERGKLNKIYNCTDLAVSTNTGEGWGFMTTEAFCTKTLAVMPNHSANRELIGDEVRGYLLDAGTTLSEWGQLYGFTYCERPFVNTEKAVEKLCNIYDDMKNNEAGPLVRTQNAYEWALEHDWNIIAPKWADLIINS